MSQKPSNSGKPRRSRAERPPPPALDRASFDALALHYVGRFASSKARLARYLDRKLRERGWGDECPADVAAIVERMAELGYVDDAVFAEARARSLSRAGYGRRRVTMALAADRIAEVDREEAERVTTDQRVESALRFARKRRLGPHATAALTDPAARQKALGAFLRAGHDMQLARRILALAPGEELDEDG
jgi:regulatory protein